MLPSKKVAVPVGVPGAVLVTVAVIVIASPKPDGLSEDTRAVVVGDFVALTICVTTFETLGE